jgi:hypothetical protein
MEQKGLRLGHFLALAGALLAVGSLWRPWYSLSIPPAVRELFSANGEIGSDPGLFGQLARGFAAAIPGSVSVSGWEVLNGADVAIAIVALAVVAAVLAASGAIGGLRVDAGLASRAACAAGTLVLVLAVWHVVDKPGADQASEWLHPEQGLWMALAGGVAMLAGGLWASAQLTAEATATGRPTPAPSTLNAAFPPLTPDLPPVFAETAAGTAGSSVPPPRS